MKQLLQGKFGTILLASLAGLVVAAGLWYLLGVGNWYTVRTAIHDIAIGRGSAAAQAKLELLNDRAYVLERLEDAVEGDSFDIGEKANLLGTLLKFNQPRAVTRALDSKSLSTQRATCWLLYGNPEHRTQCGEIALAWLRDSAAEERSRAALICSQLDVNGAREVFLEIVQQEPRTVAERQMFQRALAALKNPMPQELIEHLLKLAADPVADPEMRGAALETLQRIKEGPRDQVLQVATEILTDQGQNRILRSKAALGLVNFPEDRSWEALESVLLSDTEQDRILQRSCLYSLAKMSPDDKQVARRYIDKLKRLLFDRRVYDNPYWPIKVDVATTLAALNAREGITIDIMSNYLVDEDKDDKEHVVRGEGWLTLWTLTGRSLEDMPSPNLFRKPPQTYPDPLAARDIFVSRIRPGISPEQSKVVAAMAKDLPMMQRMRQMYQSQKATILEEWRVEAEAKKARSEAEGPAPGPQPGNVGPQAPTKEEDKGSGEEEKDSGQPEEPEKDGK